MEPNSSSPFSFKQFNDLVFGIEVLYAIARRISDAIANQPCEYLIQEGSMAFVKISMDGAGKTTFADELASVFGNRGLKV